MELRPSPIRCACRDCLAPVMRVRAGDAGLPNFAFVDSLCARCAAAGCSPYGDEECRTDDAWVGYTGPHPREPGEQPPLTTGEALARFILVGLLCLLGYLFFQYLYEAGTPQHEKDAIHHE